MTTPDGAQTEGRFGNGVLMIHIDNGHRFVCRIEIPVFEEGPRGFTSSGVTARVYYSLMSQCLGGFRWETDEKFWEETH